MDCIRVLKVHFEMHSKISLPKINRMTQFFSPMENERLRKRFQLNVRIWDFIVFWWYKKKDSNWYVKVLRDLFFKLN